MAASASRHGGGLLGPLLELLFPRRCPGCGLRGVSICDVCRVNVPWLGTEVCPGCAVPSRLGWLCRSCGAGSRALDGVRAACRFDGIARTAVHDLKYRRVHHRAELLGDLLAESVERRPLAIDLLVPVPLAPARQRSRGFNQSELIARRLGERMGVPMAACLTRVKETPPQVRRSREERRENVAGAFACREPARVAGRRIAIVDDVMTTGSTLDACAEVLKANGAVRAYGLVVAREI